MIASSAWLKSAASEAPVIPEPREVPGARNTPEPQEPPAVQEIHNQNNGENEEDNCHNPGRLYKRTFHGTSLVLSPVCICRAGDCSESGTLSFLHNNNNGKADAVDYIDNRKHDS